MRGFVRPWEAALAVLLLAASLLPLAVRDELDAQARAVVVLASTLDTPVLGWGAERLTREPDVLETTVAGTPATVARPGGGGPWPALVIVNGATVLGRREPALQRFVRGLARAGYLAVLPDLPGLANGEVGRRTVAATVAVARSVADSPDARHGRVGLVGVSVGTSLALLAAEDPSLADSVSIVAGTAPYADLAELIRLATTGHYREGNLLVPYEVDPFLAVAAARSLAAALPPGPERSALTSLAAEIDEDADDPLAPLRTLPLEALGPDARSLLELLGNRDPQRFDALYAALPAEARTEIARLSPLTHAERLRAPVELASAPDDPYVPPAEARA
ncbi:MAG: alpha/beta hydrolase family protein, partial [Gaiellaceae bacterium]